MKRFLSLPALAALLLVGCEGAPSEPLLVEPGAALAAKSGPVASSARGSGHFTYEGEYRTFAFTVRKSSDGSTAGMWQLQSRHTNSTLHGEIQCVSFEGNAAWFSGTLTQSDNPLFPVGSVWGIIVVDNGEGANASPDQVSLATQFSPAVPTAWCGAPLSAIRSIFTNIGPFDIENGNVQVRP